MKTNRRILIDQRRFLKRRIQATWLSVAKDPSDSASSSTSSLGGEMEKTFVGVPMTRVTMVLSNALPVMGGMVSQNVLNLVDAAMIARLGTIAVAATGLGSTANFQCQALLQGVSSAVQAIAARSYGKSMTDVAFAEKKEIARPLNGDCYRIVLWVSFGVVVLSQLRVVRADVLRQSRCGRGVGNGAVFTSAVTRRTCGWD